MMFNRFFFFATANLRFFNGVFMCFLVLFAYVIVLHRLISYHCLGLGLLNLVICIFLSLTKESIEENVVYLF